MLENIKDIILFILIIIVVYLLYKTSSSSSEKFDVTDDVKTAINTIYKVDLDAMRNLGSIAKNILSVNPQTQMDTLILPANLTTIKNTEINGNLKVSGSVNFSDKNNNIMEIFPRYMVIAWATDNNIPLGWRLCDGKSYYKNQGDETFMELQQGISTQSNTIIVTTPDLRGRFVLGSGNGIVYDENGNPTLTNLTSRILNDKGGEEKHTLLLNEMPAHTHGFAANQDSQSASGSHRQYQISRDVLKDDQTSSAGGDQPHNNMPPFYVLTYIMKL